jgi:hypothetical protein
MGMLSKNERKRHTYGAGLQKICRMALSMLDTAGVYPTTDQELKELGYQAVARDA